MSALQPAVLLHSDDFEALSPVGYCYCTLKIPALLDAYMFVHIINFQHSVRPSVFQRSVRFFVVFPSLDVLLGEVPLSAPALLPTCC